MEARIVKAADGTKSAQIKDDHGGTVDLTAEQMRLVLTQITPSDLDAE